MIGLNEDSHSGRFHRSIRALANDVAKRLTVAALLLLSTGSARAGTINVAAGEVVVSANGVCSLREAIDNAETDLQFSNTDCDAGSGPDTIQLAAGSTYTLSDSYPDPGYGLSLVSTELVIEGNGATIERDGSLICTLNGVADAGEFVLLVVSSLGQLTVNDVTLQNGCADTPFNDGGAVHSVGQLTITNSIVRNSAARDKSGGIDTGYSSVTTIENCTITGNSAAGAGGVGNGGTMTIIGSTISENAAGGKGGGGVGNRGVLSIVNSTISNNSASGTGGGGIGVEGAGTVNLSNVTVTGNAAPIGGGIGSLGTVNVKNSIVANSVTGGDCTNLGTFAALGDNLDTDGTCAALDADFVQVTSAQLNLGPLADNSGLTFTHALLDPSSARDIAADCTELDGVTVVATDQRGVVRPQLAGCDAGAFEAQPNTPTPSPTQTPGPACAVTPLAGCDTATKNLVKIRNTGDANKSGFLWKWIKGTAAKADFGDPTAATGYALCVYRDASLVMSSLVLADGDWTDLTSGYKYLNTATNADGVFKVLLKEGTGKAKILVKAKGANLSAPSVPVSPTTGVTVQLVKDSGPECWASAFASPFSKDEAPLFKDKEP